MLQRLADSPWGHKVVDVNPLVCTVLDPLGLKMCASERERECVCVCVRVCVRERESVCVCVRVRVSLLSRCFSQRLCLEHVFSFGNQLTTGSAS